MKKITLSLSNAQFEMLTKLAELVQETPERLAVGQLFMGFDSWGGWSEWIEVLPNARWYADTGEATTGEAPHITDGLVAILAAPDLSTPVYAR